MKALTILFNYWLFPFERVSTRELMPNRTFSEFNTTTLLTRYCSIPSLWSAGEWPLAHTGKSLIGPSNDTRDGFLNIQNYQGSWNMKWFQWVPRHHLQPGMLIDVHPSTAWSVSQCHLGCIRCQILLTVSTGVAQGVMYPLLTILTTHTAVVCYLLVLRRCFLEHYTCYYLGAEETVHWCHLGAWSLGLLVSW